LAIGATRGRILRMVLLRGVGLTAAGVVIGCVLAAWTAGALESLLFGLNARDSRVYLAAATVCAGLALAGSVLPALRATRVNAIEALRAE
jgi:ABC-type antimicrobial peptide transport system permease subunit